MLRWVIHLLNVAVVAVEPRLSDAGFTGNSATSWYLFSDPVNTAVLVGFLDGVDAPRLETFGFDSEPEKLAMSMRVYFDYGCALGDFRASVRSAGVYSSRGPE